MFCTKCGAKVPDGSNFCPKCGAKIRYPHADVPQSGEREQGVIPVEESRPAEEPLPSEPIFSEPLSGEPETQTEPETQPETEPADATEVIGEGFLQYDSSGEPETETPEGEEKKSFGERAGEAASAVDGFLQAHHISRNAALVGVIVVLILILILIFLLSGHHGGSSAKAPESAQGAVTLTGTEQAASAQSAQSVQTAESAQTAETAESEQTAQTAETAETAASTATTATAQASTKATTAQDAQKTDNSYVLPQSNSRYYTKEEIEKLSDSQLAIARNEIFARYGRKFGSSWLQEYFNKQKWYTPKYEADWFDANMSGLLTPYDSANCQLIIDVQNERAGQSQNTQTQTQTQTTQTQTTQGGQN